MKRMYVGLGLTGALLSISILLAGCTAQPEITPAAAPPTPAVVAGEAAGDGDADGEGASSLASRFPLPAPTGGEETPADSDNCITCHTDQEALESLAEEPEEVHLSEGEG
jgi:hypothetical protein